MPLDRKAIENAIRQWVLTASGFPDQRVIWRNENGNALAENYIDIALGGELTLGVDAETHDFDAMRPAGEEIEITIEGDREFSVSVECFTKAATEQLAEATARTVLSQVQTKLGLPSNRAALYAVGVACFDLGSVQWVPAVIETGFQGRAVIEPRFYARDDASERTGYIKRVEVLDTVTGNVIVIDT